MVLVGLVANGCTLSEAVGEVAAEIESRSSSNSVLKVVVLGWVVIVIFSLFLVLLLLLLSVDLLLVCWRWLVVELTLELLVEVVEVEAEFDNEEGDVEVFIDKSSDLLFSSSVEVVEVGNKDIDSAAFCLIKVLICLANSSEGC